VDGFLEAEKIGRASLVGHSLGGAVAAAFAVAFPWKLERMVLVSPIVPGARGFRPGWPYRLLAIPGLGELAAALAWKGILRYFLRRCFASVEPEELEYLLGMGYDVRASADRRRAYLATLREVGRDLRQNEAFYRDHLGRLPADVLFVTGEADPVVPRGHVRAATALFRRAKSVSLPGCGHFPQIERAEEFSNHLTSFLAPPR
jgi:pimeloyl-ACP methyl ester carboxylesterase